jgi:hypothetical protein
MNKTQEKQYEEYKKSLQITNRGEDFVLKNILQREWNRRILLYEITKIKLEYNLITIKCRTNKGCYDFSVSNLDSKGWDKDYQDNDSKKEFYISCDISHKMD